MLRNDRAFLFWCRPMFSVEFRVLARFSCAPILTRMKFSRNSNAKQFLTNRAMFAHKSPSARAISLTRNTCPCNIVPMKVMYNRWADVLHLPCPWAEGGVFDQGWVIGPLQVLVHEWCGIAHNIDRHNQFV